LTGESYNINCLRRITILLFYFRRNKSTDWEYIVLYFSQVYTLSLFNFEFLRLITYLIGYKLFARFVAFKFFSDCYRSWANLFFSVLYCYSYALRDLLDFNSYLTVPIHSMILFAYSLLAALLTSYSLSKDLKASICIIAAYNSCSNFLFYSLNCLISLALRSILTLTWLCILRAETEYCRVESVYSR
jgi:hypothetical protein